MTELLNSPLLRESFRRDWYIGIPNAELAALYNVHVNNVTKVARRLDLPKRTGRPDHSLGAGRWVPNGRGILVWEEAA